MKRILFASLVAYALWLIHWRCRDGNLWSDIDGVLWTHRATLLVTLTILAVALAGIALL